MLKEMRDTSENGLVDQSSVREFCEMLSNIIEETRGKKKLEITNLCAKRLIEILTMREPSSRQAGFSIGSSTKSFIDKVPLKDANMNKATRLKEEISLILNNKKCV